LDANSAETKQADSNQLIDANSTKAGKENTDSNFFKAFVIDKNAVKDLNQIIGSILRGETPEGTIAVSATENIPKIQIKPCPGQPTAAEITPMVSRIGNVKTCYEHQAEGEYCRDWQCKESDVIEFNKKLAIQYNIREIMHGSNPYDWNYNAILTMGMPNGYILVAIGHDEGTQNYYGYRCNVFTVEPMEPIGQWDIEIAIYDFIDSTEARATTYIDVVECPNKCNADLWQHNSFLNYETKTCQYETLDCDSLNTAGEWEYYCSGKERRKRRMTSDYGCRANGCYLDSQYYSDDQLVEKCIFVCQTDRCVNGCSGTLTIKAENLWADQHSATAAGKSIE